MKLLLFIIAAIVVALIIGAIGSKLGWFKDEDKNLLPDAAEDTAAKAIEKAAKVKKEIKNRSKRVKEELKDVQEAAGDLADQLGDVVEAAAGKSKTRKGRKPAAKKPAKPTSPKAPASGNGYYKKTRKAKK